MLLKVQYYWPLAAEMDTVVQIQKIEESCLSCPLLLRLNNHMGCQIEDTGNGRRQALHWKFMN